MLMGQTTWKRSCTIDLRNLICFHMVIKAHLRISIKVDNERLGGDDARHKQIFTDVSHHLLFFLKD